MDPSNMRIFEGRYFNINRKLLICLGLWPYQRKSEMFLLRTIAIGLSVLWSVPQLIDVIVHTESVDRQMLSLMCFLSLWLVILKVMGMILAEENIKEMYRRIAKNWQPIQDKSERDLLHKYSERARTVTIIYFLGVLASILFGCSLPLIPKILDKIIPLENLRPDIFITEGEFFIDKRAHFTLFFIIQYVGVTLGGLICVAFETMYIVSVEHCCALYAVVRYRLLALRRIVQERSSAIEDGDSSADSYQWLLLTVQLHRDALAFTSLLNVSYSTTFFFVSIVALCVIPLACCGVISQIHDPLHCIPYALYSIVAVIQGFLFTWQGQRIIDHQLSICDAAYCNEWYERSLRTKRLLLTLMLRCSQPAKLTAAGLLEVNFELYWKIIKTAFSYVAVLLSFR